MHFSWAVLLPGRQVGDLCLSFLPGRLLHNSNHRSYHGWCSCSHLILYYGEIADDILADFCIHNLSHPFVKGFYNFVSSPIALSFAMHQNLL